MDDIVNVRMVVEHFVQSGLICDIDFVEFWALAADELNAVDNFLGRVVEIVDNNDLVICFEEG